MRRTIAWALIVMLACCPAVLVGQTNPAPGARQLIQGGQGNATARIVWPVTVGGADSNGDTRVLSTDTSGGLNVNLNSSTPSTVHVDGTTAAAASYTTPGLNPVLIGFGNNDSGLLARWIGFTQSADGVAWTTGTPAVANFPRVINAAGTYDRLKSANGADATTGTGLLGTGLLGWDGTNWNRIGENGSSATCGLNVRLVSNNLGSAIIAAADNDAGTTGLVVNTQSQQWNGSTFERTRGNVDATVLASTARTTTTASTDQTNFNGKGATIFLNVTVNPGAAETLTLQVQKKDPVSGTYVTVATSGALAVFGAGAAATGCEVIELFPGAAETAALVGYTTQALSLPRTWRVNVVHSAAGSWTYSVGSSTIN